MDETNGRFISSDGHVIEPPDLWLERIDKRFRDRAPHVEHREKFDVFCVDGLQPFAGADLGGVMATFKVEGRAIEDRKHNRKAEVRAGAFDPVARLSDQDLDNIGAEVIYPGDAFFLFAAPDLDYKHACIRAYNDWLADFCSVAPGRLLGAAMLPIGGPIEAAVEEVRRVRKKGLRTVCIPCGHPKIPYGDSYYQPLFSELQETSTPLSIHNAANEQQFGNIPVAAGGATVTFLENKYVDHFRTLTSLIASGVPQAFPRLNFVIVEGGIGWVAAILHTMDHWWEDHHLWLRPRLDEKPSFYCHRQFHFTFEEDRAGLLTRELLNVEHLMWGSDYPHTEGTFPFSIQRISEDFTGVPDDETRMMVRNNAAHLYGID
jgi:uncharacterized protein